MDLLITIIIIIVIIIIIIILIIIIIIIIIIITLKGNEKQFETAGNSSFSEIFFKGKEM